MVDLESVLVESKRKLPKEQQTIASLEAVVRSNPVVVTVSGKFSADASVDARRRTRRRA